MQLSDHSIGPLLAQLCRAHRNVIEAALQELGMHVGQEHVLYRLTLQEGVPQSQLAEALCLDASTVTKMLQRLERDGLLERQSDAEDARVSRVYLTARGKATVQPLIDIGNQLETRLLRGLTELEQILLRRLLLQLLSNLS